MIETVLWALEWIAIGLLIGGVVTLLLGIVEGLFGMKGPAAILGVCVLIMIYSIAANGIDPSVSSLQPLPYWIGLLLGCLMFHGYARKIQRKIQIDGKPRYRQLA